MLGDGLARHIAAGAKLAESLPVPGMEAVQQFAPRGIGKRLEDRIHAHETNMQPFGCIFKPKN
jgi:hypothetical protein